MRIEKALPAEIRAALRQLGHDLFEETAYGASQAVGRGVDGKGFASAGEPRADGQAAGF